MTLNEHNLLSWKSNHVPDFHPCPGNPPKFYKVRHISESAISFFTKSYLYHPQKVKQGLNYIQKIIEHYLGSQSDQKHRFYFWPPMPQGK